MQIQPLTSNQSHNEILFESFVIENLNSFDELIEVYQTYKQNHPDKTIILTLDDLGQAEYTSGHSIYANDLDETEGYDLSGLDKTCFENGEHLGYLSTPSEFFIRKENFLKQTKGIDFKSVCDKELTIDEDEISILENINQSPFEYLDDQIILKIVPVEKSYEAMCGFPNGYFESDLNPFENYALAKHLFENYNFELFGIGASFLGFIRNGNLEENRVKALITDLSKLYSTTENTFDKLAGVFKNQNYLFLKYIEYLE
ncbi:hypothetical protein EG359_02335 [Chryseobacterium joostei]|uniref:DUF3822 family protein n=1 Tax=Chryseobacterium joostei TaxID=112234 RepID=A0A1N7ILW9_9FLAO|nr:hypothetical protein [Chryseobacterium joostei]AZA98513.1 hypothetical protein EG359_02335 [Chryseobacterium joostei]SIS38087.1 hypothetical protein SAMN05421768_10658 [Chryseobacterium joostei]